MSTESHHSAEGGGKVVLAIVLVAAIYVAALVAGLPQKATALIVASNAAHGATEHADGGHADAAHADEDHADGEHADEEHAADDHAGEQAGEAGHSDSEHADAEHADHGHGEGIVAPPVWTVIPFVLLLGAIALLPLIPFTEHWWESNLHRLQLAAVLGLLTLAYYGFLHEHPIDGHFPAHYIADFDADGFNWDEVTAILGGSVAQEYVPFIVLLFSLYTICGGIRIEGDLQANPMTNAIFMGVGGALASFIGTTGAAMLFIRPLLETNSERKHVVHTVVFFIFIVCNCGGCLLPIGDPPLFLGYLAGVNFFWTMELWPEWLMCNGLLLIVYLLLDELIYYRRETEADITRDIRQIRHLKYMGVWLNGPLLLGVVAAVAFLDPSKTVPGTDWHPWLYLREMVQLGLVATSLALGAREVRRANSFNYHAIQEVAALFIGIFVCMQPALQILGLNGKYLADNYLTSPMHFYWVTGALSSVLDNAPTYLVFFKTAQVPGLGGPTAGVEPHYLTAISLGAVFMGAMTYIGNGPNFMVKAIAEKSGVKMPSFFGYMAYSCLILLPILAIVGWRTFR
ncbi:Citrate transporter [Posidoniimonas polymericola]|uniref:Citrate transporter n=1 Tax=Posidoniimonas polymericola TaxID=2528002 RepID=A0A5C5YRJ9_9BACT|nr:sodium:proton antiporter [Posidoniimonas polymericola]TWT77350.1 Citrate transporter [Posidoniimonas polymericola]